MKVAIIKYNAGNIQSVNFALQRLGVEADITANPEDIRHADKVIFPGVGEASSTMSYLRQSGLDKVIRELKQPVLGICLGLQLMCGYSEEGDTECLGIFNEKVFRFQHPSSSVAWKVPHMGWNTLGEVRGPLFSREMEGSYLYFVHSFYAEIGPDTAAVTDYILPFSSALQRDNFYATQFHPEKSGAIGSAVLQKFLSL